MAVRVSGRINESGAFDLIGTGGSGGTRDDSPAQPTVARRSSPKTLRLIERSLSAGDRAVIEALATVRMASGGQLNRLVCPDDQSGRTARRRLARLTELRVIGRLGRQVGGVRGGSQGFTYALDTIGQRLAEANWLSTVRRPSPSDNFIDHTLAVTELYVALREADAAGLIELGGYQSEPECWRQYRASGAHRLWLKPDAFAAWMAGEWELLAFFEVDLGTEHPGRLERTLDRYVRYWQTGAEQRGLGVFPAVVWVAKTGQRAEVIRRLVERRPVADRELFRVTTAEQFRDFITNDIREEVNP